MAAAVFVQAKPRLGILPFPGGTGGDGDTIGSFLQILLFCNGSLWSFSGRAALSP
jgi:hypothetical protein